MPPNSRCLLWHTFLICTYKIQSELEKKNQNLLIDKNAHILRFVAILWSVGAQIASCLCVVANKTNCNTRAKMSLRTRHLNELLKDVHVLVIIAALLAVVLFIKLLVTITHICWLCFWTRRRVNKVGCAAAMAAATAAASRALSIGRRADGRRSRRPAAGVVKRR